MTVEEIRAFASELSAKGNLFGVALCQLALAEFPQSGLEAGGEPFGEAVRQQLYALGIKGHGGFIDGKNNRDGVDAAIALRELDLMRAREGHGG